MIYYYPNRPTLIPPDPKTPLNPKPDYVLELEGTGKYVAEQKWNGDNLMIHREKDRDLFFNRYKEPIQYVPSPEVTEELKRWPTNCMLNAELMHRHTIEIKHVIIVHCIMAWEGKYLIGKTWGDSRDILEKCRDQGLSGMHVKISPVWRSHFWHLFQIADGKTVEGIILKNPAGKLQFSSTPLKDVSWMLKIRKTCKKYPF